ncbi:MAG TPA: fumarylacetoacetate hydrolase family protein [Steroidobacteraceae bacterium]|jgi:fumarylacetoacetate (FAA) hydrolase|nr:fumarylacetoacetate hydrolase family protein [Steroidobacteraceae bacterium]
MKLATLKRGGRDGRLVVVSRDLAHCQLVPGIAPTLQAALDDWAAVAPRLAERAAALEHSSAHSDVMPFDAVQCAAPLPRAYHWVDGSAYVNHVELVRKARGAEMPASFWTDPLVYQGGSDDLLGARDDAPFGDASWGIDLEAEVAVVTDDVPMGTSTADAAAHIKLVMLVNDWSLRGLIPGELAKGFGFYQSKPATAFSPVAVTPDELGEAWRDSKVHLPLVSRINEQEFGRPDAGTDMTFSFAQLIAHVTRTRRLGAGAILGSGTVSNYDRSRGSSCLAEKRTLEQLEHGAPRTPFLQFGDRVAIEMFDARGQSIFGALDNRVVKR